MEHEQARGQKRWFKTNFGGKYVEFMANRWWPTEKKVHQSFSYTSISFLVLGIFLCIQYDISEQISV